MRRFMDRMIGRRSAVLMATLGLLAGGATVAASPTPAYAVGCYGDYCSGQDPQSSGCAADGVTVSARDFSQGNTNGRLELRWSNTCKTNWARVTLYATSWSVWASAGTLSAVQDTNYTQSANVPNPSGTNGVQVWTPMIYSPVHKVQARYLTDTNPCRIWINGCLWSTLDVRTDYV